MDDSTSLKGLRVIDFSRVLAGPYSTMLLGDLGADVIKIERPGAGDDTRSWGPPFRGEVSTYFLGLNRNKRSVAIDLATSDGMSLARELVSRADVVVENFRPGSWTASGSGTTRSGRSTPGSSIARSPPTGRTAPTRTGPAMTS